MDSDKIKKRYLFIRILEACNANCFMCSYALSKDRYRFSRQDFDTLVPEALAAGVGYVRFTGGEPLLHADIEHFVSGCRAAGLRSSIISNGAALAKRVSGLSRAGLDQIIVSIDGLQEGHDDYRGMSGLFFKCVEGLMAARSAGLRTRVNTVVGPHNYKQMPELQRILGQLGVHQWELSALKLGRRVLYPDRQDVVATCEPLYIGKGPVPMGRRFYGDTDFERDLYFEQGVAPRAEPPHCGLVGEVIYVDPKKDRGFGCSLLPHRDERESLGGVAVRGPAGWSLASNAWHSHVERFRELGPRICTGCSSTAAGYSDRAARGDQLGEWAF